MLLFITLLLCSYADNSDTQEVTGALKKADWLIGKWRSEFHGKIVWPTVPTMTYGEELEIQPAPLATESGLRLLNYTQRAWSHSTKDRFLDSYGFISIDESGDVAMISTGNNGFSTFEKGKVTFGLMTMKLDAIGRISIAREIPVVDLEREFRLIDDVYMEQVIRMRTIQHPHSGLLEHARILYERVRPAETTAQPITTRAPVVPPQDLSGNDTISPALFF